MKLLPDEKSVTCLDDLLSLKVSELKKILCSYNEKVSGNKADLVLRTYAVFSRAKEGSSAALSGCTDPSICKYHEMYSLICGHLPWVCNLRGTPPFTFVQSHDDLVLRTSRYKHIFLKQTGYKKTKSFKFFYEGFIRNILVAKDGDHTFFDVPMKASMKNTLYKVLVVLDSSGNVSTAACTCPAGSALGGFGNCNHVGGVLFALEDFNRKDLHQSKEPVSCTSKLSAWNIPSSSVTPVSIDEILLQKIKFGAYHIRRYKPRYNPFDPHLPSHRVLTHNIERLTLSVARHAPKICFFDSHDMLNFHDMHSFFHSSMSVAFVI